MISTPTKREFPECENLVGRLKDICRGEADLPLDGANSINSYRVNGLKLPRLNQSETLRTYPSSNTQTVNSSFHSHKVIVPQKYKPTRWVGTNLALLLKKFGVEVVTGCGGCDAWMNEMNVWGSQGCRERFAEIKERLKTKAAELKAKEGNRKIIKIGVSMIIKAQWPSVDALIHKAIKQAEKAKV